MFFDAKAQRRNEIGFSQNNIASLRPCVFALKLNAALFKDLFGDAGGVGCGGPAAVEGHVADNL